MDMPFFPKANFVKKYVAKAEIWSGHVRYVIE